MNSGFSMLTAGMKVRGADARWLGTIKEVHESEVVIHRRLQPTVHLLIEAIRAVTATEVVLPQRTPPGRVMAPLIPPPNRPRLRWIGTCRRTHGREERNGTSPEPPLSQQTCPLPRPSLAAPAKRGDDAHG
jgi:hypothetical protein